MDLEYTDTERPGLVARRRLIRAGVGGAALSLLPFLARRASATTPDGTETGGEPEAATSTTAPPQRPTADDIVLLNFAQSLEMVAVLRYDEALAIPGWSDDEALVMGTMREAHLAYVNSLSGMLGGDALKQPYDRTLRAVPEFGDNRSAVLASAGEFEAVVVATHNETIGELQGTSGAALLAAAVNIEARSGSALAALLGSTDLDSMLLTAEAEPLPAEGPSS